MNECAPNHETALTASELLIPADVEWQRIRRIRYVIHQQLRYEYPGPIYDLEQRLMILPAKEHGNQQRIDYRLEVSTTDHKMICQSDDFENEEMKLSIPKVEQAVDFEAWIVVERTTVDSHHLVPARWLSDTRLLEPSRLTQPDEVLRRAAVALQSRGKRGPALAEDINEWVYQALTYEHEKTDIHTTAAEALALGRGVCQDYAHIMLVLCRMCGLPARYVSGHMLGEGGTHAWVEVLFPVTGRPEVAMVITFDPTHNRRAGMSYLTVAVGRDYYDVAPTSGTYRATYRGQLSTRKRVGLTSIEYIDV
jgi:transglutaminase-like putative cysteine protease